MSEEYQHLKMRNEILEAEIKVGEDFIIYLCLNVYFIKGSETESKLHDLLF